MSRLRRGRLRLFPGVLALVLIAALSSLGATEASVPPTPDREATADGDPTAPTDPAQVVTFGVQPSRAGSPDQRPFFSFGATPGASLTDEVAILNYSNEPLTLSVYATDAVTTDTGGFGLLPGGETPIEAGSWVTLDLPRGSVTVPPRQGNEIGRVIVPMSVAIPADAPPGDHAAGIVAVLTTVTQNEEGTNVNLDQRVGSRVFVRVAGDVRAELLVEDLRTEYTAPWNPFTGSTAVVRYTLRNVGNAKLAAQQAVEITGLFGGSWSPAEPVPDVSLLLPGGAVQVEVEVPGVQPRLRMTTTVDVVPLRFEGDENGDLPTVTESASFWAIPWLVILVLALILGYLLFRYISKRTSRGSGAHGDEVADLVAETVA